MTENTKTIKASAIDMTCMLCIGYVTRYSGMDVVMIRASKNSAKKNQVTIDNFFAELNRRNV